MLTPRALTATLLRTVALAGLVSFNPLPLPTEIAGQAPLPLGFTAPALAKAPIRYTPPKRPTPRRTDGTGTRGGRRQACDLDLPLTPLVPNNHIGQTTAARPTFFWYLAGKRSLRFAVADPRNSKPIWVKSMEVEQPGIVAVELPPDVEELVAGREYRWSVAVICQPNQFTEDMTVVQASIQRVAPSAELEQNLRAATSDQSRGAAYAAAGMWYDALGTLVKAAKADPNNSTIREDLLTLLDQGGLNKVTAYERQKRSQTGRNTSGRF